MTSSVSITPNQLAEHWPLQNILAIEAIKVQGRNNRVLKVVTQSHDYLLRLTNVSTNLKRAHREQTVTRSLKNAVLPFAIPAPLMTRQTETFVRLQVDGVEVSASLWPFVVGDHFQPDTQDTIALTNVGAALGQLAHALDSITPELGTSLEIPLGDLTDVHPHVSDPMAAVDAAPFDLETKKMLRTLFSETQEVVPPLYQRLPQGLIHGDFIRSNLLMRGDEVAAVLDFEFSRMDFRALDLATALMSWSFSLRNSRQAWIPIIDALGRGYVSHYPLTWEEREALPFLCQLRFAGWMVYFIGQHLDETHTADALTQDASFAIGVWQRLHDGAKDIIETALRW